MDVNKVTGYKVSDYETENSAKKTKSSTEQAQTQDTSAAVYDKSTVSNMAKAAKTDTATIEKMKAEADARYAQLKSLVEKMMVKQGEADSKSSLWDALRKGEVDVDPETAAQAQADIADDGYWGVEQTSDRLVSFAKALAGNDSSYANQLIDAIKKGFDDATKDWGDTLPDLCQKTMKATIDKMEAWRDGTENC